MLPAGVVLIYAATPAYFWGHREESWESMCFEISHASDGCSIQRSKSDQAQKEFCKKWISHGFNEIEFFLSLHLCRQMAASFLFILVNVR